jgi:hypothetical protein
MTAAQLRAPSPVLSPPRMEALRLIALAFLAIPVGLRFIWIAYVKRRTSHLTPCASCRDCPAAVVSCRGLRHNRSQQPSVVLNGVTGHSRSLRNCQGFGSAQITLEPLKGPPIETRIERLVDGKTALDGFALIWILFLTSPPRCHKKFTGQSRFAQWHPARSCPCPCFTGRARPPGLWFPHQAMGHLHSVSALPHSMSCPFEACGPPKNPAGTLLCCASVSQEPFATGHSPWGGMFCHTDKQLNKPVKKGTDHENDQRSGQQSSKSDSRSL